MTSFTLNTNDIIVGYAEHGFFAWGITDNFSWNEPSVVHSYDNLPTISGRIEWSINHSHYSLWDQCRDDPDFDDTSERAKLLKQLWSEQGDPCVKLQRTSVSDDSICAPVSIAISLPQDANLTAFIMSAAMANRTLTIRSSGWSFIAEDRVAPAVSYKGWQERFEPAFSSNAPILGVK